MLVILTAWLQQCAFTVSKMPEKCKGLPSAFIAGPTVDDVTLVSADAVIALFGKWSLSFRSSAKQTVQIFFWLPYKA